MLANPNPENEHVGVDDEGLYLLDLPPPPIAQLPTQLPPPPEVEIQAEIPPPSSATERECPSHVPDEHSETDSDASSVSDDDNDPEMDPDEADEMVKDHEPDYMAPIDYDKNNPPPCVLEACMQTCLNLRWL
jgi:hypothetical protein